MRGGYELWEVCLAQVISASGNGGCLVINVLEDRRCGIGRLLRMLMNRRVGLSARVIWS